MRPLSTLIGVLAMSLTGCDAGRLSIGGEDADRPQDARPSLDGAVDAGSRRDAGRGNDGGEARDSGGDAGSDAAIPLSDLHFIGRFDFSAGPTTPWLAWPGTEIVARFRGTSISVRLDDGGANFFDAWVDGAPQPVIDTTSGPADYTIASGLTDDEHTVRIARATESFLGRTRFLGFPGATLIPSAPPYAHLIEFIGDSITCGVGVLGVGPGCPFSPDTESEPDAYGALAAQTLGAGHVAIAYAGHGLYRNYDLTTDTVLPVLFERRLAESPGDPWDFSYTPDVVVVNLGTNDFGMGDPGMPFVDACDAFVMQLRGHYPGAAILLTTSPMLGGAPHDAQRGYLSQVIASAAARSDTRVSMVDFDPQSPTDGLGCDYHPSATTHRNMAALLVTAIRGVTGW